MRKSESWLRLSCRVLRFAAALQVIGMYQTLLGRAGFRKGMDLYFARHDGTAVTCDDFRAAMADANGADLAQFERWYTQAGTPQVRAREMIALTQLYHCGYS